MADVNDTSRHDGPMEKGPIDHIERSLLPWRRNGLTECGLPTEKHPVITRDEVVARVKNLGQKRAVFTTCMTCWETASRHATWEQSPQVVMNRETRSYWGPYRVVKRAEPVELIDAELRAIAALIEAHREEFDSYVQGLGDTGDLADRRVRRERIRRTLR